jgi:hypothetical protein
MEAWSNMHIQREAIARTFITPCNTGGYYYNIDTRDLRCVAFLQYLAAATRRGIGCARYNVALKEVADIFLIWIWGLFRVGCVSNEPGAEIGSLRQGDNDEVSQM